MRLRLLALALLAGAVSCAPTEPAGPSDPANESYAPSLGVDIATMVKVDKNLYYKDVIEGTGSPAASVNKTVVVTYTGYLTDGTVFDSKAAPDSLARPLNDATLIAGWVLGLEGMKPGGTRKLVIGSSYGYGSKAQGDLIPANSTLVFDIHLKAVR